MQLLGLSLLAQQPAGPDWCSGGCSAVPAGTGVLMLWLSLLPVVCTTRGDTPHLRAYVVAVTAPQQRIKIQTTGQLKGCGRLTSGVFMREGIKKKAAAPQDTCQSLLSPMRQLVMLGPVQL